MFVLPMIRRRHSPTPIGLMQLSFFLSGTSLHDCLRSNVLQIKALTKHRSAL